MRETWDVIAADGKAEREREAAERQEKADEDGQHPSKHTFDVLYYPIGSVY